jgi:hypothetical protein
MILPEQVLGSASRSGSLGRASADRCTTCSRSSAASAGSDDAPLRVTRATSPAPSARRLATTASDTFRATPGLSTPWSWAVPATLMTPFHPHHPEVAVLVAAAPSPAKYSPPGFREAGGAEALVVAQMVQHRRPGTPDDG